MAANIAVRQTLQTKTFNGFELVGDTGPPKVRGVAGRVHETSSREAQGHHAPRDCGGATVTACKATNLTRVKMLTKPANVSLTQKTAQRRLRHKSFHELSYLFAKKFAGLGTEGQTG